MTETDRDPISGDNASDLRIGESFHRHENWYHAGSATIVGDVHLGAECSIWYGAVLRGDDARITLGERVNVQDLCMVHADPDKPLTIGDDVTIGHGAVIHCVKVGSNTLIGMGSVLLEDVVVGDDCLIAAGAVVPPGSDIPDGSLVVGVPGKVVRKVTEEEKISFIKSAKKYADNAREFHQRYGSRS
ncbi:MAG: hypothetical protein CBC13_06500 [Planctomycetia bacterium TMED53]|nr:MAG: hypothetical protein CBC13_06500 [Planctomycetia bacterium TMED53]